MIPAIDGPFGPALEPGQRIREARRTTVPHDVGDVAELVGRGRREPVRQRALVGAEHAHGEHAGCRETRERRRGALQAPEDQRRIERYRRERVDGEAFELAVGGAGGDDGDARGEPPERVAQRALVDLSAQVELALGHVRSGCAASGPCLFTAVHSRGARPVVPRAARRARSAKASRALRWPEII